MIHTSSAAYNTRVQCSLPAVHGEEARLGALAAACAGARGLVPRARALRQQRSSQAASAHAAPRRREGHRQTLN